MDNFAKFAKYSHLLSKSNAGEPPEEKSVGYGGQDNLWSDYLHGVRRERYALWGIEKISLLKFFFTDYRALWLWFCSDIPTK